jgi:hypothetical protein
MIEKLDITIDFTINKRSVLKLINTVNSLNKYDDISIVLNKDFTVSIVCDDVDSSIYMLINLWDMMIN